MEAGGGVSPGREGLQGRPAAGRYWVGGGDGIPRGQGTGAGLTGMGEKQTGH